MPEKFICALEIIKRVAAETNIALGLLGKSIGNAAV